MTETVSEVLDLSADKIERDGWWQSGGRRLAPEGKCAGNAITFAGHDSYNPAHTAFAIYLGGTERHDLETIWDWNDTPGRTAAEVVEALRACAVIEAAKETADEREPVAVA